MAPAAAVALLLALALFAAAAVATQAEGDACLVGDDRDGVCTMLPRCSELFQMLQTSPTRETFELLSHSNCGYEGKVPIVCCPQPKMQPSHLVSKVDTVPAAIAKLPNDVSIHPRINLLPVSTCGHSISDDRILGGNETGLFEFPWMALLGYKTSDNKFFGFRCGGSLISSNYILTAAHCILNDPGGLRLSTVRLGEHNLKTPVDCEDNGVVICAPKPQNFDIERAIAHPFFSKDRLQNDIGLVRIRGKVRFTDTVQPICLPVGKDQQQKNLERKTMIVAGWGVTETGTTSQKLLKVGVPVVPIQRCASAYKRTNAAINIKQICAGGTAGRDSCAGDSGGPLMTFETLDNGLAMVQYGLVSFGPKQCATEGYPGVYTRIAYFMDWILDNMQ